MYFTFYPVSRLGMTKNVTEMMEWDEIANGIIPEGLYAHQMNSHQEAFNNYFPTPEGSIPFQCPVLGGGYILGNGDTDITDRDSQLHNRSDFPYVIDDGYISVSTQKLTAAPYHAYLLEREIFRTEKIIHY